MLSWLQPESAWAAGKPDAAAAARASGASFAQVIVTCLTAHTPTVAGGASQKKRADQLRPEDPGAYGQEGDPCTRPVRRCNRKANPRRPLSGGKLPRSHWRPG